LISFIRNFFACVILLTAFAVTAYAQEAGLPSFVSFSYLRDPLFNGTLTHTPDISAVTTECATASEPLVAPVIEPQTCPEIPPESALSQNERFELQLALDKALSQILKLTVDYEALLTRVQSFESRTGEGREAISQPGSVELDELLGLNNKRLADRDQQLAALQNRLDALQTRYDTENVSRLLAEKQLKALQSENNKAKNPGSDSSKLHVLAEQLEKNQSLIQNLETNLASEKLRNAKLFTEQKQALDMPQSPDNVSVTESPFKLSREWVIEGLRFKEGSADIELDSIQNLNVLIAYLEKSPDLNIQVNGYTDSIGSAQSNMHLSQARANAVADYLIDQGVEFFRIKSLGYGERRPLGDNEQEQGRVRNRRVAVLFLD